MRVIEKLRNFFARSYGSWFLNQISNEGRGFAFVARELEQNSEAKEARLTITILDATYPCRIEISIEKTLVEELGLGMPAGFQQVDLIPQERDKDDPEEIQYCKQFNARKVRWVADEPITPDTRRTIVFPARHLERGFGQITIGLPFKLGLGGGVLNANSLIGLGSPEEIEKQTERWKDLKLHWLNLREPSGPG